MKCTHDLADMDTAAHWDGLCPLCLKETNERLRNTLRDARDKLKLYYESGDKVYRGGALYKPLMAQISSLIDGEENRDAVIGEKRDTSNGERS